MFCPVCRTEYREGFTECSDCGTPLVDELPPEPQTDYLDWVTVMTTTNENDVVVATSVLEDAGIPVFVQGQGLENVLPSMTTPKAIQVMPGNIDQAREILARKINLQEGEDVQTEEEQPTPPEA